MPTGPLVVDLDPIPTDAGHGRPRRWTLLVVAAMVAALQFLVWRWWRQRQQAAEPPTS